MSMENQSSHNEVTNYNPDVIEALLAEIQALKTQMDGLKSEIQVDKNTISTNTYNKNEENYKKISYKHPWDGDHFTDEEKKDGDLVWDWHWTVFPLSPKEWNDINKLKEAIIILEQLKSTYNNDLIATWWKWALWNLASWRLWHINDEIVAYTARIKELELH